MATKKPSKTQSNIKLSAGSFGHGKASAAVSSGNIRVSASHEENSGIDSTDVQTGSNDDEDGFTETAINLAGNFALGDSTNLAINGFFADNEIEFDNLFGDGTGFRRLKSRQIEGRFQECVLFNQRDLQQELERLAFGGRAT